MVAAAFSYLKGAHDNKDDSGNWNWNPSSWDEVPALGFSTQGNFDQNGMNISVQPTITPTGTSNSLPIGPTVDWDVDFGNPLDRDSGGWGDGNTYIKPYLKEEVVQGIGVSIEVAFPIQIIKKLAYGIGVDFGVVEDSNGFSFYATTKYTLESGIAGGISVETFDVYKTPNNPNRIDRFSIREGGFETSGGIGAFGGAYGTDNRSQTNDPSNFYIWTFSLGVGSPVEYVNWRTNTYVSGNR